MTTRDWLVVAIVALGQMGHGLFGASALAQDDGVFEESPEGPTISQDAQADLDKLDAGELEDDAGKPWTGPRLEVGYEHFSLSDGRGAGATHLFIFGGFIPLIPELRLGLSLMGGIRDFSYQENDMLLGARAIGGYQHIGWDPVLPYVGATLMGAVIIGERFSSSVAYGLVGLGLEAGLDLRIANTFYGGVGLGYTRADMDGLAHDLLIVRLRVGL